MIGNNVSAVQLICATPPQIGIKRSKLSIAASAFGRTNVYRIALRPSVLNYSKFLQQIFNHKRRRWSVQSGFRLCDLPTSLCAEEG
jgi:hypothetical protein